MLLWAESSPHWGGSSKASLTKSTQSPCRSLELTLDCPPGLARCQGCPGEPSLPHRHQRLALLWVTCRIPTQQLCFRWRLAFLVGWADSLPPDAEWVGEYFVLSLMSLRQHIAAALQDLPVPPVCIVDLAQQGCCHDWQELQPSAIRPAEKWTSPPRFRFSRRCCVSWAGEENSKPSGQGLASQIRSTSWGVNYCSRSTDKQHKLIALVRTISSFWGRKIGWHESPAVL